MNAQEAIEVVSEELAQSEVGIMTTAILSPYELQLKEEGERFREALSVVLESAKLLHEEMIDKVLDDGMPYIKLKNGSVERATHSDLTDIGLMEDEVSND